MLVVESIPHYHRRIRTHRFVSDWRLRLSHQRFPQMIFDVVHEGLLGFVAADVHHLDDGVFVRQVHVGASASGSVGCDAIVSRHYNLSFGVTLYGQFARCLIVLLFHCQFGGHFDRKRRYSCRKVFKYVLDATVDKHINHRRDVVVVFLADGFEFGVHYRYLDLVACFLLNQSDYRRTLLPLS